MPMLQPNRRVVLAGLVGNMLEWYDFGLYGLLAPLLAARFFPGHAPIAALLSVYGGFAAGFAMRPIGAVFLGRIGDRIGRRHLLLLSIVLMGAATVAMGLLPTFAAVGLWAPVALIAARLLQGFSVGGEFVGSVTYLVETASPQRRGLAGSVANLGSTAGMLLAAAASALAMGWDHSHAAAWRFPFLFGGVLAVAGIYLRRHLPESKAEARLDPAAAAPLRQAWREAPRLLLATVLLTSGYGIVNYVSMVFLPTYAHQFAHVPGGTALRINTAGQALALVLVPLAGWASDRFVRRRTLLASAFACEAALAWYAFAWVGRDAVAGLWVAQLALAGLLAVVMGTGPALLAEQFAPAYRVSAHAVAFNIGIGIAGGTAPLVALALIRWTANPMAPAFYLLFAAALAAASALALRDRTGVPLEDRSTPTADLRRGR